MSTEDVTPLERPPLKSLRSEIIRIASDYVGVRESGGANRGQAIDAFLRNVGLDPDEGVYPWCAAFCYWVVDHASVSLSVKCPCPKTPRALGMWFRSPVEARIRAWPSGQVTDPERIRPGCIFVIDHGSGRGHCGFVEGVDLRPDMRHIYTIEGNTNASGGSEGDGVYRRTRKMDEINCGYVDYGMVVPSELA